MVESSMTATLLPFPLSSTEDSTDLLWLNNLSTGTQQPLVPRWCWCLAHHYK